MLISGLVTATNTRLLDNIPAITLITWFDDAQNKLASRLGARFPNFLNPDGTQSAILEPVWDRRFHDLLVIYACARFRESDEAMNEAQYLDSLFNEKLNDAVAEMVVDTPYRDDDDSQQFVATVGQVDFTITKQTFYTTVNSVRVFVNGVEKLDTEYRLRDRTVTLFTASTAGNLISIVWESAMIYNFPPQPFQGSW